MSIAEYVLREVQGRGMILKENRLYWLVKQAKKDRREHGINFMKEQLRFYLDTRKDPVKGLPCDSVFP